jgi:hypothetical protein
VKARSFLRNLFPSRSVEGELDEEIQSHLEMLTEENIRAGMTPEEARRKLGSRSAESAGERTGSRGAARRLAPVRAR